MPDRSNPSPDSLPSSANDGENSACYFEALKEIAGLVSKTEEITSLAVACFEVVFKLHPYSIAFFVMDQTIVASCGVDATAQKALLETLAAEHPDFSQTFFRACFISPLLIDERLIGYIGLGYGLKWDWKEPETTFLTAVAGFFAIAVEQMKLFDRILTKNVRLATLLTQNELLSKRQTEEELISTIGNGCLTLSQADMSMVYGLNAENQFVPKWNSFEADFVCPQLDYSFINDAHHEFQAYNSPADLPPAQKDLARWLKDNHWGAIYFWPVVYQEQILAVLACTYRQAPTLEVGEPEGMEAFAREAAVALENLRLLKRENKQHTLAEALRDTAAILSGSLNLQEVLDLMLANLSRVVPHDTVNIMLVSGDSASVAGSHGYLGEEQDRWVRTLTVSVSGVLSLHKMSQTREPLVISDTLKDPNWTVFQAVSWIRSYVGAPICLNDEVIGFINVDSHIAGLYQTEHALALQAFAGQAAVAIQNARLYSSLQSQVEETQSLYRATSSLMSLGGSYHLLAEEIVNNVARELTYQNVAVLLLLPVGDELKVMAQVGELNIRLGNQALNGPGITVACYRSGETISVPDVQKDPHYVEGSPLTRSELAIPLIVGSRVIGVLNLECSQINGFDERIQRILVAYAKRASMALENARLFGEVERHAVQIDMLNEMTRLALEATDRQTLSQNLVLHMGHLMEADACLLMHWDKAHNRFQPVSAWGQDQEIILSNELKAKEFGLHHFIVREGQPLVIEDIHHSPYINPDEAKKISLSSVLGMPLNAGGQLLGTILVGFAEPHRFGVEEIVLGEQAADQVALAYLKMLSLEEVHRRAHEAEILRQATETINSSLDLQNVLDRILEFLQKVVQNDGACIFLVEGPYLRAMANFRQNAPRDFVGSLFPCDQDALYLQTRDLGRPLIIDDVSTDERFKQWGETSMVRGWMGVPLIVDEKNIGILTLDSDQPEAFGAEQATLAQAFANQAAVAVKNARLYEAERQRAHQLEALHMATTTLVSTLDLPSLLERILLTAASAIPMAQKGSLQLLESENQVEIHTIFGYHDSSVLETSFVKTMQGYAGRVMLQRQPLIIRDLFEVPSLRYNGEIEELACIRSVIAAPLMVADQVVGALTLESDARDAFTEIDLRLLTSFGLTATAVIRNAQLHAEVQRLAITDPLTGLYNRRGLTELGQREVDRASRFNRPLSMLMLDIDHFKHVNDTYGHSLGDQVLQDLARRCQAAVRDTDIICRYGGEEIVVLLPETAIFAAREAAERIRLIIAQMPFSTEQGLISVTVSIGVSGLNEQCGNLEDLINTADQAMYAAKVGGRNRVVVSAFLGAI